MKLKDLLDNYLDISDDSVLDQEITSICCDSRQAEEGCLFVAMKGHSTDGHRFIDAAIEKGASVIVCDQSYQLTKPSRGKIVTVENPKQILRDLTQRYYGSPSDKINTIGITGTNGKTTISYLVEAILTECDKRCGVIGTVNYRIGERIIPSVNTTPGFLDNQKLLSMLVEDKVEYCIMEVSSHALDQDRVDLINFKSAVFSNLTSDHLDYHNTREEYFEAKSKLFKNLEPESLAIINIDDEYGAKLLDLTPSRIMTFGIENEADICAKDIELGVDYTQFKIETKDSEVTIRTNLVGMYNIYNILAASAVCLNEGISLDSIKQGVEYLRLVPGRLEKVQCQEDFSIFIDYAHTQDALENVLTALRSVTDSKIILVFGCGGDRDTSKRSLMGEVASRLADYSIITSDNPRSEDPKAIIKQIVEGFVGDQYEIEVDRERAIIKSLNIAQPGDIVLIAGKGHEDYQTFKDESIKFDERTIIRQYLRC